MPKYGMGSRCNTIEVISEGFDGKVLVLAFKTLGNKRTAQQENLKKIIDAMGKTSRWLWIKQAGPFIHLFKPKHTMDWPTVLR